MKNKVRFNVTTFEDVNHLGIGNIEDYLGTRFKELTKPYPDDGDPYFKEGKELIELLKSRDGINILSNCGLECYITDFFSNEATLNYNFAKNLNRFDVFGSELLLLKNKEGILFKKFLILTDTVFIVWKKFWISKNELKFDLIAGHRDFDMIAINNIIQGKYGVR